MTGATSSRKKRLSRRVWMGLGLAGIAAALALLIAGGLRENVVFFLTPTELHARGAGAYDAAIRLGGQVKPESVDWDPDARDLRFIVTDGDREVPVRSTGAPPAMFRDGIGVVVEGRYRESGVFESNNVMVKHSNEYRPPDDAEAPHETYRSLIREDG